MSWKKELRQRIDCFPPISEAEADELADKAHASAKGRVGNKGVAKDGEDQALLDAAVGIIGAQEFNIAVMARQTVNAADAFFHERSVIEPSLDFFTEKHRTTRDALDEAWSERRSGIRGMLRRDEIQQKAALRDTFYEIVDAIGREQMGEENYDYYAFIHAANPVSLLAAVQSRLDANSE